MAAAVAAVRENLYIFPHSRGHAMGYETINVTPVTPRIGAEVDGLTLAKDLAHKKGWGPQAITVVTMGNAPTTIIAAFREHLVDAYVNVTSLFLAMEENKTGRVLAPVSQYEGKLNAIAE